MRFLAAQEVERDGARARFFAGCFGIFGHGNVAGLGQALHQHADLLPLPPGPQRAGDGPRRRRLRAPAQPAGDVRLHDVGRPRRDEHGHRRGAGDDQPPAGAAAARRHVRDAHAAPGAAAARGPARRDRVGQRLLPAGVALLRARRAPRAAHPGGARGDARAHRPGRDRRRDAGAARGRAGRGVRLARGVPRAARVDDLPPAAGAGGARARGRADPRRAAAADRRGRRRDLQRGDRRAAGVRRRHRHPGLRDAGRARRARLRPSAEPRRGRRHRHRRPPTGWRARPTS